jgi:glutamate---cysteine ligase / carboxylate-amine ligase
MAPRGQSSFTFGIEEEYFLVSLSTCALVSEPPRQMLEECSAELGQQFSAEYQRSQVEVATKVRTSASAARAELAHLRNTIAAIASRYGLAPIAASTHPFTPWSTQRHADKQRYNAIAHDLRGVGRRMVISGMHVHVGIDDDEQRIAVMNEMRGFLPLLLALSTSSPFWQGENTGLKSYRTAINDATPRKGIPERFASWSDYCSTIGTLVRSGVIEDATTLWWDLRPSARFPTLELRITDICPVTTRSASPLCSDVSAVACIGATVRDGACQMIRSFCSMRTAGAHSAMACSTASSTGAGRRLLQARPSSTIC